MSVFSTPITEFSGTVLQAAFQFKAANVCLKTNKHYWAHFKQVTETATARGRGEEETLEGGKASLPLPTCCNQPPAEMTLTPEGAVHTSTHLVIRIKLEGTLEVF